MSRLPKGVIVNQELVSIEFEGRMVSGTYTVRRGGITVTSEAERQERGGREIGA